jgi:hypothetical protein
MTGDRFGLVRPQQGLNVTNSLPAVWLSAIGTENPAVWKYRIKYVSAELPTGKKLSIHVP